MNLEGYDFIDFGAGKGSSMNFALRRLGGTRGLGIDIKPEKVKIMSKAGYDCVQGDVTNLDIPPDSVRFVVMSHFLEHLPDLETVEGALRSAARVASDFLFIQGPYFDAEEFLKGQGLKFPSYDWHAHTCHLTTSQLRKVLLDLGLEDFVIMGYRMVSNSFDPAVHPLESPSNQGAYDPEVHPSKPFVDFQQSLYKEMVCCVRLQPFDDWKNVLRAREGCVRLDADTEQREPGCFSTTTQQSPIHQGRHEPTPDRTVKPEEEIIDVWVPRCYEEQAKEKVKALEEHLSNRGAEDAEVWNALRKALHPHRDPPSAPVEFVDVSLWEPDPEQGRWLAWQLQILNKQAQNREQRLRNRHKQLQKLEGTLEKEHQEVQRLREQNRRVALRARKQKQQLQNIKGSRTWNLLERVGHLRAGVLKRFL